MKKIYDLIATSITGIIAGVIIILISVFISLRVCAQQTNQYCEKCVRLEKSILNILYVIERDKPDYVMDVLSEYDEWYILEELIGPIPPVIKDSTYHKLHQVFPDLPARKSKPDKHIDTVKNIDI